MATQTVFQEQRVALNQLVRHWDRRLRVQQASLWLPRALLLGLFLGVLLTIVSRLRPWLVSEQILLVTAISVVMVLTGMLLAVWLWPRPALDAARRFDLLFGLQERVSTALELIDGRIRADDELLALQVDDAWSRAQQVQPDQSLPLIWRWREWAVVGVTILMLAILLLLPNPQAEAIEKTSAEQASIDAAKDEVAQIIQEVASDPALNEEERQELLEALAASMDTLEQPDVTTEEAFATLSDAQTALQQQADRMNERTSAQQDALEAASDALRELQSEQDSPTPEPGQTQPPAPIPALNNLAQNLANMTPEQMQQAAQSLEQAAQALQESNPQASQAMQQAAQAMREGDTQGAQQALQEAADALQQAAQDSQSQESSAQEMSESAQEVQQAAGQVGQQSNSSEQGQQNDEGQPGQEGDSSDQQGQEGQPGEQGEQGQQGQQGQGQQQGQQEGQQGQQGEQSGQEGEGDNPSSQESQGGQSGGQEGQQPLNAQGDGAGSQEGQSQGGQSSTDGAGTGAGDSPGGAGSDESGGDAQSGGAPQDNNPDGQGEGQFEPVYAPQRPGGEGGPEIQLDPNSSDAPVQEGEFSQNPTGNTSVPYNQVFSDYSDAANRALESDYIPLGLRDVVRDYFSSLEPGR
ncbi:MAG: hypothetical protein K8L97_03910 [Anaerolineae bacterium]|nr:hypothetical protein [Anaerolineae bacterium]